MRTDRFFTAGWGCLSSGGVTPWLHPQVTRPGHTSWPNACWDTPPAHCMLEYTPCEQNEWHTGVKTLPCPKLRLRVVVNMASWPRLIRETRCQEVGCFTWKFLKSTLNWQFWPNLELRSHGYNSTTWINNGYESTIYTPQRSDPSCAQKHRISSTLCI